MKGAGSPHLGSRAVKALGVDVKRIGAPVTVVRPGDDGAARAVRGYLGSGLAERIVRVVFPRNHSRGGHLCRHDVIIGGAALPGDDSAARAVRGQLGGQIVHGAGSNLKAGVSPQPSPRAVHPLGVDVPGVGAPVAVVLPDDDGAARVVRDYLVFLLLQAGVVNRSTPLRGHTSGGHASSHEVLIAGEGEPPDDDGPARAVRGYPGNQVVFCSGADLNTGAPPYRTVAADLLGVDVRIAVAVVLPGDDGSARVVRDYPGIHLLAGLATDHAFPNLGPRCVEPCRVDVETGSGGSVCPDDDGPARAIRDYLGQPVIVGAFTDPRAIGYPRRTGHREQQQCGQDNSGHQPGMQRYPIDTHSSPPPQIRSTCSFPIQHCYSTTFQQWNVQLLPLALSRIYNVYTLYIP